MARPRTERSSHSGVAQLLEAVGPLQPQRLVLTILGNHARGFRLVWSGGLVELLADFGFSSGAARVALGRLVQRGYLARVKEGRRVHYRLTNDGEHLMTEGDRRIFSFGTESATGDTWTVVWHSMPDEERMKRAALARRLRFLGFGPVQDGTWVSPHDREREVVQLLIDLGATDYAGVLLGRPAKTLDFGSLISRAWDLEQIEDRYRAFISSFGRYAEPAVQRRLDDRDAFRVLTLISDVFKGFPSTDPEFSPDVMHGASRSNAVETFHGVYEALAEPAQRHFDAVAVSSVAVARPRRSRS
ncbi:MAG: PaaX family transcriptional regulator C-terminal domain-containing protein [Thermoleophilaceae bacterium]